MIESFGRVNPGTVLTDQLIPKSVGGGTWPHLVDFYVPNEHYRSYIALHGGGGFKGYLAFKHRIKATADTVTTPENVNWGLLNAFKMIAVYPQGQSCSIENSVDNPWNPNGVNTYSDQNPSGVPSWSNGFMWSGADDVSFLKDLKLYIKATFGAGTKISINGTSNGGMMVQYMHMNEPVFDAYTCIAGPRIAAHGSGYSPSSVKPLYMMFGRLDPVLGIHDGIAGLGDHWFDSSWWQQPEELSVTNVAGSVVSGSWVPQLSTFIPPHMMLQPVIDANNTFLGDPAQTYAYADGVNAGIPPPGVGTTRTWTYCQGRVTMQLVSDAEHTARSFNLALYQNPMRRIMAWMAQNDGLV